MYDVLVHFDEYQFSEGDLITELFTKEDVQKLRDFYKNNCYDLAQNVSETLRNNNVLHSIITFKGYSAMADPVQVQSDFDDCMHLYTHHSVIFLGTCFMDILHSDRLFSVKEYLIRLSCRELQVDLNMSTNVFNKEGYPQIPDIEFFINYVKESELCTQ